MDKRLFLRNALRQKQAAIGMWLTLPGTALARTIATVPGLNWMLIDGEHGLVSDRDFYEVRFNPLGSFRLYGVDVCLPIIIFNRCELVSPD